MSGEPRSEEEQVIRDWLDGQLSPSGSPLPPARRTSQPLPRRQVTAVVATLIELLDEARAQSHAADVRSGEEDARLRLLANEAISVGWYSEGYFRSFIDEDDDASFSEADARFMAAVSPLVILALLNRIA